MISSFKLNQGESNSCKKIEFYFQKSKKLAGMSLTDCQKNMSFDYPDDDGYFSHNEDRYDDECDSEDYEDRDYEAEDYEAVFKETEADKIAEANDQYFKSRPKLQDPDKMEKILPARILPSIEEQEKEYAEWLEAEIQKSRQAQAVTIIERFFSLCLKTKDARIKLNYERHCQQQLSDWKSLYDTPRAVRGILRLTPLPPFEEEYLKYSLIAAEDEKKNAIEKAAIDKAAAEAHWAERMIEQQKARAANGKKRALAKKGMNKNTAWHRAREADSLAKDKSQPTGSTEGQGKRAQRKIKQEKKRKEAIEYEQRLNLYASESTQNGEPVPETEPLVEISDEEQEDELALALYLICKPCTIKIDICLQQQQREADEKKKAEQKERESWTTIGNKKPKKKVMSLDEFSKPVGIIARSIKERSSDDTKYAERCEAFDVLADKEKIDNALKFTQMCRSVLQGKKCYHPTCRFAHTADQLVKRECRFGLSCKFVKHIGQGKYIAQKFGRTGKSCACYHPNETEQSFCLRLNLKYTPKPVTPKPVTPKPVTPTPVASPTHEDEVKYDRYTGAEVHPTPIAPVSAWASIVTTAEAKAKYAEAKAKMTRSWTSVVSSSKPSPKPKPVTPKNIIKITKPKFVQIQPAPAPITPTLPSAPVALSRAPAPASPMDKVREAVDKINQRISIDTAVEINLSLSKKRSRQEDWTQVQSKKQKTKRDKTTPKTKKDKTKKNKTTVFKVRKENAEMAIIAIMRSGIKDFKIEIIDSDTFK